MKVDITCSAIVFVSVAACGHGSEAAETPPVTTQAPEQRMGPTLTTRVWLEPADLSTDVGTTPIVVRFQWPGTAPTAERLAEMAAAVSLTDGAGRRVAGAVSEPRGDMSTVGGTAEMEFTPEAALDPGWYILRLERLDDSFELSAVQRLSDGNAAARFHIGSLPLVQHVQICERSEGQFTVLAELSERVRSGDALAGAVLSRPDGPACSLDLEVDPMVPPSGDEESLTSLRWSCTSLGATEELQLVVPSGLRALSGSEMAATSLTVSREGAIPVSDRCSVIRGNGGPALTAVAP